MANDAGLQTRPEERKVLGRKKRTVGQLMEGVNAMDVDAVRRVRGGYLLNERWKAPAARVEDKGEDLDMEVENSSSAGDEE